MDTYSPSLQIVRSVFRFMGYNFIDTTAAIRRCLRGLSNQGEFIDVPSPIPLTRFVNRGIITFKCKYDIYHYFSSVEDLILRD